MIHRLALLSFVLAAGTAQAQTRHLEATGGALAISSPCARTVTIQPDPALSGKFILDARAAHEEETARLLFDSGATAKLHVSTTECDAGFLRPSGQSTLDLTLRIPPATNLAIEESGGARYTVGAVGKLTLDLSGGIQLDVDSATDAAFGLSGGSAIKIGQITGNLKVDLSGGGDIRVGRATVGDLSLSFSGGGDFTLAGGAVNRLNLDFSGAGNVRIGAPVVDATISMSGAGEVHLARVTGRLTKDVSGVGTIDVGESK